MAKLTDKQKDFLKKHNMWNADKDKSKLGVFEEGNFKDFFRRREKVEQEITRLPEGAVKTDLKKKLQDAENKATKKDFKEAYRDLKTVKVTARAEANGYSDSLDTQKITDEIESWRQNGENIDKLVKQLEAGMKTASEELQKHGKAGDLDSLEKAAAFLRDFKPIELLLRSEAASLSVVCGKITSYLNVNPPPKKLDEFNFQFEVLRKKNADLGDMVNQLQRAHVFFIHNGKTLSSADVRIGFQKFRVDLETGIKERKNIEKFQPDRDPGEEKISDDTLMRNPTQWNDNPTELDNLMADIAKGNPKSEFDNVMWELGDIEIALKDEKSRNSAEFQNELKARKKKALRALKLLEERDEKRSKELMSGTLLEGDNDKLKLAQTEDKLSLTDMLGAKEPTVLAVFDADTIVSDLDSLPANLKKAKTAEIQQVRQEVKTKMEGLLDQELKKPDSDVLFDLSLKTKEEFVAELASVMGIDLKSKKLSKEEKLVLDEMADQMVATVREKYPNKAGGKKVTLPTKDGKTTEVPTEFVIGDKIYSEPKYLASGGVGDVLRYKEEGSDPPKYTVVKTLQDQTKRDDMVRELKLHRQANGGEKGANSPYVVELEGAIQGPNGEIYMAMEFADGGDLNDMSLTLAQASIDGNMPEQARQILTMHMMRQAIKGMKQVQDNNMTHHDLKGMNYLIGGDGTVKVADFGSGQVADEDGTVPGNAPHMITTQAYKAPELGKSTDRVTGKADTFSLGVMLGKLAPPLQGQGPDGRVDAPVTALDKLRKAMTDPDPDKRPTLDAVLYTSYMTDPMANHSEEEIADFVKVVMDYNKHVASKAKKEMRLIVAYEGQLALQRKKRAGAAPETFEEIDQKIAEIMKSLKEARDTVSKVLAQDDSKPYVEALKKASEALLGRGKQGPRLDPATVKFKEEYEAIAKTSGKPADAPLLQSLTAIDQAGDATTKKKLAETAVEQVKKLVQDLVNLVKTTDVEKDKQAASLLATDLRKLQQALATIAK